MAITTGPEITGGLDGGPEPSPATSATPGGGPTAALNDRGGGPKSPKGKRRSSRNATKHGVFAKGPIIGDEQAEDFEDLRQGLEESYRPLGRNEEFLVHQISLNRWKRLREERWIAEKLQHQLDGIGRATRASTYPELMGLPEDEAAWWASDPSEPTWRQSCSGSQSPMRSCRFCASPPT